MEEIKGGIVIGKGREEEPRRPIICLRETIVEEELPVKRAKVDTPSARFAAIMREYKASSLSLPKLGLDDLALTAPVGIQETVVVSDVNDE